MVTYRFIVKIILKYLPVLILISANSISARQFAPISSADAGKMLNELDKQLSLRKNYLENRVKRIDSIKYQLTIPRLPVTKQLELTWKLARLYEGYLSDSAVIYFRRGQNTAALYNHNEWEIKFKIKKCETMPLVALFNEAIAEYSTIHIDSLNGRLKILALDSGRQLYSYVASFYSDNPEAYRIWIEKSMYFQEQLIKHTDPNTPINTYNRAEYLFMTGKYRQAGILFHSLLNNRHPLEPYMAARINHKLSKIAAFNSNHNEEIYYLAKSAIADIKSATLEIVSLQDLGQQLYTHGDLKRAYSYLAIALDNSVKCHAANITGTPCNPAGTQRNNKQVAKTTIYRSYNNGCTCYHPNHNNTLVPHRTHKKETTGKTPSKSKCHKRNVYVSVSAPINHIHEQTKPIL